MPSYVAFFCCLFVFFCYDAVAQQTQQTKGTSSLGFWQQKYPQSKAIYLKRSKELHLVTVKKSSTNENNKNKNTQTTANQNGDSIACSAHYYTEVLHLNPNRNSTINESVNYSYFQDLISLKAYTVLPNQKKIVVKDFVTQSLLGENVFFDDLKAKSFVFPAVCAGAKTVVDYTEHLKEVKLLGSYYFNAAMPVVQTDFTVITSPDIEIGYKVFGHAVIDFKKTIVNQKNVYHWRAKDLKPLKNEEKTAKKQDDEPHIIVYLLPKIATHTQKNTNKDLAISTSPNLHPIALTNLYAWYYQMAQKAQQNQNTYLDSLVNHITKNSSTDYQKAEKLYEWVQKNIRYIAFEDGLGGFIPRKPVEVCQKRYGDCKDMANLLFHLAKAAHLETYLVWVGTRNVPYKYTELAVPLVDNHVVTAFWLNNQYVFADATTDYLPFGMPSDFIQGKEGLLSIDSANYKIVHIPTIAAKENNYREVLNLQVIDNQAIGKGNINFSGYAQANILKKYHSLDKQTREQIATKNNKQIQITTMQLADQTIHYDLKATALVREIGNDIFLNMHIDKKLATEKIDTTNRQTAYYIDFAQQYSYEVILQFPQTWHTYHTPLDRSFEHEKFSFRVSYQHTGLELVMRKEINIHCLSIEKEDFWAWNSMIEELNKAYQETVSWYK
jgi:hypothetical protein